MKKSQADYFLGRIYKLLENDKGDLMLRFLKLKNEDGRVISGKCWALIGVIHIDPRKDLLPTLIHESLHMIYDKWSERKVIRVEKALMRSMSERQFANLIVRLADYLVRIGFASRKVNDDNDNSGRQEAARTSRRLRHRVYGN